MDPTTGDITMTPVLQEVSVLSVMISEYREGVLIGSVVRDMAIYVRPCTNNLPELSGIGGTSVRDTVICPGTSFCFDIQSSDIDASQRLTLQWNQGIPGANFQVSTGSRPTGTFCWTPGPGDARSAPYMFTVTVRDDACPMSAYQTFSYSITVREPYLQVLASDVTCHGGIDGSAYVLSGTPGSDIQWSTGQSGVSSLSGLAPGSYSVTLTDPLSGCSVSRGFTVTEPSSGITVVTDSVIHATCQGESNGFASVSVVGGTGGYSYEWIMLPNTQPILSTTSQISNAASGDYAVRVTDGNGCIQIQTVSILAPPSILLTGASLPATCGASDGSAAVNVAGGTPGYLYDWGQGFSNNSTLPQVPAGIYRVSVVDANGCQAQGTVNVSNIDLPIPTIIAIANVSCNGLNDGKAVVIPQGGVPPFTYTWSTVPVQHSDTVYGLSAGTYTASIMDANGCQAFNTIVIESPAALDVTVQSTQPDCHGGQNGSLEIGAISGGTAPFTYAWNGVQNMHPLLDQLSAGTYNFTVTDANGCEFNGQAILDEPDELKLTLDHVLTPLCYGGNDGSAAVSVIGGSGAVTFNWDFNGATSGIISGVPAGDYEVTATDNNGCTSVLRLTIPDPPQLTAQPGSDVILCEGDGLMLNAVLEPGQSGVWSSSVPSVQFSDINSTQATVAGLIQGDNRLIWTVTDPFGCTASAELSVTDFSQVEAVISPDTTFCGEAALLLRANLPAGMTGTWNSMNGAVFSDPSDPSAIVNIINAGRDTLRWTLSAGQCEKSALMVVYSRECDFGLPTAYSPNSDGKNDSYEIKGLSEYPRNVLRVFNRWGNEVFSQKDFRNGDWFGQNGSGELLPDGTYFVIFESVANDFRANSYVELRR
jgi:gliding motility-associated-like protein